MSVTGYTGGVYDTLAHTQTVTVTGVGGGVLYTTGLTGTNADSFTQAWSFSNANYKSVDESGTLAFTITPAATTTTVTINGAPFTYSGYAQTPATVTVTGPGLSLTPMASYLNNTDAGTATASYSYLGGGNYQPSSDSKTFDIGQANATVAVTGYTGGGTTPWPTRRP